MISIRSDQISGICKLTSAAIIEPAMNLKMLLNFYSDVYYKTADYQLCPFRLPNPDCLHSTCARQSLYGSSNQLHPH
jgi:hypothetical protein